MSAARLGAIDATYLDAEEPRAPLHVASIGIFEGGPLLDGRGRLKLDELRRRIDARLVLLPRMRQRVLEVPFGVARPVWVDDVRFDIAKHVDTARIRAPGDEAALLRAVEGIIMEPLDRSRPLWHMRFLTGLEGGRVALVERAHHAMVDGVSGVDISMVLLDTDPDSPAVLDIDWSAQPEPGAAQLLFDGLADRVGAPLRALVRTAARTRHPADLARGAAGLAGAVAAIGRSGWRAPRLPINEQVGASRRLVVLRERLSEVRAAAHAAGGTINDVVLAAFTGGMRDLLLSRGTELAPDRVVKVLVPVSVRTADEAMGLGNRVGGLIVSLPVGIGDPDARLRSVIATTRELKASPEAAATGTLLAFADLLPPALSRAVGRAVHHQPFVNSVVTNVPGPPCTLYAMGARMLEAFPIVPLGGNMDVEVAILSYEDDLNLGFTADRSTCPDVDVLAAGTDRAFAQLHARWVAAAT